MSRGESSQQILVPGKCEDIYYVSPANTKKECIRTKVTTKYSQALTQLAGGTSVFLFPANFGLQDILVQLTLPALGTGAGTGLALPVGWGYALIKSISYRVAGSTQYFITGDQMLQYALKQCPDQASKQALFSYGGNQLAGVTMETGASTGELNAYCWLSVPWAIPSSEKKPCPLPTDLISSQTQLTIELNPISSILSINGAGVFPALYSSLASGQFTAQQVLMESRDDSMASHENLATTSYNYPVTFVQQEQQVSLANSANIQTITATGFRSGSVKSIEMWLTKASDTSGLTKNPLKWYAPRDVSVQYAGDIYAKFDAGSSGLWNLINSKSPPIVGGSTLVWNAGTTSYNVTNEPYGWVSCPFAQTYDPASSGEYMLNEGLSVTNGVVNINLRTPSAASDWVLNLSYIYASTLVFSQSTAEMVF